MWIVLRENQAFFCGIQIGPLFDAYGPRWLVAAGSVLLVGGMMLFAVSTSKPTHVKCISDVHTPL